RCRQWCSLTFCFTESRHDGPTAEAAEGREECRPPHPHDEGRTRPLGSGREGGGCGYIGVGACGVARRCRRAIAQEVTAALQSKWTGWELDPEAMVYKAPPSDHDRPGWSPCPRGSALTPVPGLCFSARRATTHPRRALPLLLMFGLLSSRLSKSTPR